jgi:hypothetical protein
VEEGIRMSDAIIALGSVLLGGVITVVVSWAFYVRAARGLEQEAEKLRHLQKMLLRGLHNSEMVEITWDEHGEPVGMVVKGSGAIAARGDLSASATVQEAEDQDQF